MSQKRPRGHAGFALLAVLWVVALVAGISAAILGAARAALAAARNRGNLTAASWRAEGCVEWTRAIIDGSLARSQVQESASLPWRYLDTLVAAARLPQPCHVSVRAAGSALDVNAAGPDELHATLVASGVPAKSADSFVAALLDWRDGDNAARLDGAEADWYRTNGLPVPRNRALAHRNELLLVRGGDRLRATLPLLDVEPARVALDHAPDAVLAALPGVTPELRAVIAGRKFRRDRSGTLLELAERLSPWARDSLQARFAELVRAATLDPDAWILEGRASSGEPPVEAVVEARLVQAGTRAVVVRRRVWP